ncbi:endonuclease NucS [Deinococcus proteolyticus]|nr:endonuclease NucS [Deinococcus proteolyticus]
MLRTQSTEHTPEELAQFINEHVHQQNILTQIIGLSEVQYHGRAASTADQGSYLTIIKPDGSIQIHKSKGVKPMNWQPKTNEIYARVENGECVLTALRHRPEELVRITFLETVIAQAFILAEEGGFILQGSESEMQEVLAHHPEIIEPGLIVLERELMVSSGGIDLYARDSTGRYVVVELKRARATQSAVSQLARYVRSIQLALPAGSEVRGILAAPDITKPALLELQARKLEFKEIKALPSIKKDVSPTLFE